MGRWKLVVGVGLCLAGLAVLYVAAPIHTTEIERSAPGEAAMADAAESYSTAEIDVVPFENLSAAERRAVAGAIEAPDGRYTDRGASASGPTFEYRNDVVSQSFVGYEGRVYLVRTWIAVDYLLVPLGVGGVLCGLLAVGFVAWRGLS